MTERKQEQTIVFFDGVCHLCNGFVDFVVRQDSKQKLRFAPLQGQTAKTLLPPEMRADLKSVLVSQDGKILLKSSAVLVILEDLGGVWKILSRCGRLVPALVRDRLYDFVAHNRYRWFGQRETCRLPTPEEKQVILD